MKSPDDNFQKALKYAFLLLRYRDRSEKEIVQRLTKKGFSEDACSRVGSYLVEKGFVDDSRFAESLKRTAVEQKHLGKKGVVYFLLSKGIPAEIAADISGDEDEYIETAGAFVEKKLKQMKGLDSLTAKRRLWGALARKGYSPDAIRKVLIKYLDDDES